MVTSWQVRVIAVAALLSGGPASAGIFTDDLSRCLVDKTTADDKLGLVRWMFSASALHPAVRSIGTVTPQQMDDANKQMAGLMMRLLTDSCKEQAQKAIKNEGAIAIQASFQVLGQVAGAELFASPEVVAAMGGLEKYIDGEKIKALATSAP